MSRLLKNSAYARFYMLVRKPDVRIILIGGSGFIGRRFAERAIEQGHHVTIVSQRSAPATWGGADWISGGMARLIESPLLLRNADVVCQFASVSTPASSAVDPVGDVNGNLLPSIRLLEAMRTAGTKRIVFISSGGAVYGIPRYSPMDEEHPQWPISSYGIVKGSIERYLGLYKELYGFSPFIIRPANPYGPGQHESSFLGFITTMLKIAKEDGEAIIFGDGSIVRDFVYIDDLCDLLLLGIECNITGVFNCGSGTGGTLLEVLDAVEQVTGKRIRRNHKISRPFDPPTIMLDITKARQELSWSPKTSLQEGLERSWASMKQAT
jgi:UDP-glucose 4-epimerase